MIALSRLSEWLSEWLSCLRYVHSLPYVILNKRTAVTRSVERRLVRSGVKTNPTSLAEEFLADKYEALASLQAQVYGMHVWAQARQAGTQLTLEQMTMDEVELVTAESVGLCAPGEALIRHFFLSVHQARAPYQLSWRQQNVPMTIGSVDATYKRGKALDLLKIRQTVFSNDVCAPVISVWVSSASLDDTAFAEACDDYERVQRVTKMLKLSALYLDCPHRDAGGAGRRFPRLLAGMSTREYSVDLSKAALVITPTDARRAAARFRDAKLLGFDCEWNLRGKVATVQISDGLEDHALFHLPSLGGIIPPELISLIKTKKLCGVKIDADLKKLSGDYPAAALNHHLDDNSSTILAVNIIELSSLGVDVLRVPPRSCASLKSIFELCYPDLELNKELCGPVWKVDWEKWPLQQQESVYALNDAGASALAGLRLLHPPPSVDPAARAAPQPLPPRPHQPPPSPPPMPSSDQMAAGAAVFNGLAADLQADLGDGAAAAGGVAAIRADGDEEEDEDEEEEDGAAAAAADEVNDAPDFGTQKTVLQAARTLIDVWFDSSDLEPLKLPTCLSVDDRGVLHAYCENLGIAHETHGEGGGESDRYLVVSRRPGGSATAANGGGSSSSSTTFGGDIVARLKFRDDLWKELLIKYDVRHFMGNWFLMAQSKSSALFKYFCIASSDAIFVVREGQRERVKAHLRKLFKQGEGAVEQKRVDSLILRVKRRYWRRHCEYTIPEPRVLVRALLSVYLFFKDLDDPETGRPFFSAGHQQRCITELQYVAYGWLSDHPKIPLYRAGRTLKTGFVLSRCLRSSSALEGYHAPFNDAMAACGHRAGLDWMEASSNEFDFRWCVRALRSAGIIPSWVRMFNLALIDEVWDLAEALFEGGGALALPGWRRTRLMALLVRQGFYYGKKALKMDSPKPLRTRRTAEDVDALMAQGVDASAETLVQVALDRGLYLSPSDAAGFIDSVVVEERARALLAERGYHDLQQALRLRAPPKPLAPPLTLGVTVGTAALPGPMAPMAEAVRDPAQLPADGGSDNDDDMPAAGARAPAAPRAPAAAPTAAPNPLACANCGRVAGNAGALARHVEQCGKPGPTRAEKQAQAAKERRAKKRAAAGDAAVEPDGDAQDE